MSKNRFVLIMAGGVGSRFWPASRESKPKQFLDMLGVGKSLLRLTFERSLNLVGADRVFIMTNDTYADKVAAELPELDRDQLFLEPSRNNTAPCIALASLKLQERFGDGVCLVAPSDHIILEEQKFVRQVQTAMEFAEHHAALVTLGIEPVRPDTGYGYIQYEDEVSAGVHKVKRFTEKPDLDKAKEFIASGDYLWNSGMFVWSISSVLDAFERHAKSITDILGKGRDRFFTDEETVFLKEYYPRTEKISIDYALMERSDNVFVLPSSFGWSDLGTWTSLYEEQDKSGNGNVLIGDPIIVNNASGNLVYSGQDKLVVLSAVNDLIVINEEDVLMILPMAEEQSVKQLRAIVEKKGFKKFL